MSGAKRTVAACSVAIALLVSGCGSEETTAPGGGGAEPAGSSGLSEHEAFAQQYIDLQAEGREPEACRMLNAASVQQGCPTYDSDARKMFARSEVVGSREIDRGWVFEVRGLAFPKSEGGPGTDAITTIVVEDGEGDIMLIDLT